jgi:hypothetical protein
MTFDLTPEGRIQNMPANVAQDTPGGGGGGQLDSMFRVPNPPHLERWRQALFDVEGTFMLTESQYVRPLPLA